MTSLARGTLFLGLLLAVGACLGRWVLVRAPTGASQAPGGTYRAAARLGGIAVLLQLAGLALLLWGQLAAFRDPAAPLLDEAGLLLGATDWGRSWSLGFGLSLWVGVWFLVARRGSAPIAWGIASAGMLKLVFLPAFMGHAIATEGREVLAVTWDALHVTAGGVWMGGLAAVLWLDRARRLTGTSGAASLPSLVRRFSPWAQGAVVTVAITGLLGAWLHLPGLGALVGSTYGRLLLLKLAAVGAVLALGWVNWRVLTPAAEQSDDGVARLRRSAALELFVGLVVVLAITSIFVETSPP